METRQVSELSAVNKVQSGLKKSIEQLVAKRFLIAGIIFLLMLLFKVHGSSINMWDAYITEYDEGASSGVLLGNPRAIRSDEWLVQSTYSLSQTQTGFQQHNPSITLSGQNMVIGYNSPAFNLATLAKPFTWGYVLLGKEYGLSWYWGIKLLGLILLSFEMGLILTKRNKYLALLASLWIPLSSAIQWWFVSPVGDLVFFTLGFLVSIYYYFFYHQDCRKRLGFATLAVLMSTGYVLVIYPALQVPLGYLILFLLIGYFFEFRKKIRLDRADAIIIIGALLAAVVILAVSFGTSWTEVQAVMNTVYPGQRLSVGGAIPKKDIFMFLTNWKLPFRDLSYLNASELSNFYHLFFVILPLAPLIFFKQVKENFYGFLLFVFSLMQLFWMSVQVPVWVAKLSLWSYVTSERAMISFGFTSVLLSIWFINYLWERQPLRWLGIGVICFINLIIYFYALYTGNLRLDLSRLEILSILFIAMLLIILLFKKWRKSFILIFSFVLIVSGLTINPVARGVDAIYKKKLATEILSVENRDPQALWAGERLLYGFLPTLGVNTFNGVAFTPDFEMWEILDPTHKYEDVYNRYAHINVTLETDLAGAPPLEVLQSDAIVVRLTPEILKAYQIKYYVSYRELETLSNNEVHFQKIYGPDADEARIYQVNY